MTGQEIAELQQALDAGTVEVQKMEDRAAYLVVDRREPDLLQVGQVGRREVEAELEALLGAHAVLTGRKLLERRDVTLMIASMGVQRIHRARALEEASKRLMGGTT